MASRNRGRGQRGGYKNSNFRSTNKETIQRRNENETDKENFK